MAACHGLVPWQGLQPTASGCEVCSVGHAGVRVSPLHTRFEAAMAETSYTVALLESLLQTSMGV